MSGRSDAPRPTCAYFAALNTNRARCSVRGTSGHFSGANDCTRHVLSMLPLSLAFFSYSNVPCSTLSTTCTSPISFSAQPGATVTVAATAATAC